MQLIGLTGLAGSGKSTVANYLVEQHGFTRLSFAAPLKKMLRTLDPVLGLSRSRLQEISTVKLSQALEIFGGDETKLKTSGRWGDEYRRLLQVLGTDCIRAIDEHFWVKAAGLQLTDPEGKYVFDDARFPNEAALITAYNEWGLWNIQRPGTEAVNGHASEQHAAKMGERIWLWNGDTVEALHTQVDAALSTAFGGVHA